MNFTLSFPDDFDDFKNVKAFTLLRDHVFPVLEERRAELEAMYSRVMGRPEVDPVLLTGITILQMMESLADRAAVESCCYDVRWRVALGLPCDWKPFHPTTLVHFRQRLMAHERSRIAMDAGLEAMRRDGYLRKTGAIRIDSTHVLGAVSAMSRLACVRETLRQIKRRTRTASLFPNEESLLRLVTAVVSEISDEWEAGDVYLKVKEMML